MNPIITLAIFGGTIVVLAQSFTLADRLGISARVQKAWVRHQELELWRRRAKVQGK